MKEQHFMQKNIVVCILALLCCFLWGSAFPSIKTGYQLFQIGADDTASQIFFAGIRFTLAGILVVLVYSIANRKFLVPKKSSWGMIGVVAMFQTVIQYFFFYIGLAHTTGVKGSILESVHVFFAVILASVVFKQETLTKNKLIGCIIGFTGVILVNLNGSEGLGGGFAFNGEGFLIIACGAYALSSIFIKIFSQKESPVIISGYQFILGGIIMAVCGYFAGGQLHPSSGVAFVLLLYMAMISAVAYSVWGLLLKYNPVSKVSIFGFSNPVFGVVLSAILLGEGASMPVVQTLGALILVCIGIFIVNREE